MCVHELLRLGEYLTSLKCTSSVAVHLHQGTFSSFTKVPLMLLVAVPLACPILVDTLTKRASQFCSVHPLQHVHQPTRQLLIGIKQLHPVFFLSGQVALATMTHNVLRLNSQIVSRRCFLPALVSDIPALPKARRTPPPKQALSLFSAANSTELSRVSVLHSTSPSCMSALSKAVVASAVNAV